MYKYCVRTNSHTCLVFRYGSLVDRNLPDHVRMEGKIYGDMLLSQYDLNLCPDGITVNVGV
jgi:hypothetical protein